MVGCWNLEWRLVPSNPKPSVILYNCSTAACPPACTDGFSHPQHRTLHSSLFQQETPVSLELHLLKLTSWSSTAPSLFLSATFQGLSDFNQQANTGPVYWCRSQLLWPYSLSQLKWMLIVQAFVSCCFSAETQKILSCFVQFLLDSADARGCRMPLFPWTSWFKDLMLFSASQFTPTENPLSCFLASFCLGPTTCEALLWMPSVMLCAQQISVCEYTSLAAVCQAMYIKGKNKAWWSFCISAFLSLSNLVFSRQKEVINKIRTSVWLKSHHALFRWAISLLDVMSWSCWLETHSYPHWASLLHFGSFNNSFFISCIQWLMVFVQEKLLLGLQNNFTLVCSSAHTEIQCESLCLKGPEKEK